MSEKKRVIIRNALQLFIEKGVENTSLQDILETASISKGTFYNYFSSKDECIVESIDLIHTKIRKELDQQLIGQSRQDKAILKEQFILYLKLNHDYQLYDLFRVIRKGQNRELREITVQKEITDTHWMAERVVEVFGKEFQSYSREAIILYHGMVQMIARSLEVNKKPLDFERIISVTMRYLEMILMEMLETKQVIFELEDETDSSKRALLAEVNAALESAKGDDKQLLEGIAEELQRDQLRLPIIQALAQSLSDSWEGLKERVAEHDKRMTIHSKN